MTLTLSENVETAGKLLDVIRPGWYERVNVETLNMAHPFLCVLGQVFGDYWHAIDKYADILLLEENTNVFAGDVLDDEYDAVFDAWVEYITARKEG